MDIKSNVEQRIKETEKNISADLKNKNLRESLNPSFIMKCLKEKALGDSAIFNKLFKDNFLYNKAIGCWMVWAGHHWEVDRMGYALASIESVAKVYENEAKRLLQKIKEADSDG